MQQRLEAEAVINETSGDHADTDMTPAPEPSEI